MSHGRTGHATFTPRTFGTTTPELLDLQAWLQAEHVTHVAWKPVYNLLEASFTTWVVKLAHMKNVPGRKTDVKDATWIADLLRHGLLTPSFISDKPQRELREITRQRTQWLCGARSGHQSGAKGAGRRQYHMGVGRLRTKLSCFFSSGSRSCPMTPWMGWV